MANGTQQGQTDANLGRPMQPQGNTPYQTYQNYQKGYLGNKN